MTLACTVYDKAKWHFRGEFPDELDIFQGYVHTGFYLTWIIENGLFDTNGDDYLNSEVSKYYIMTSLPIDYGAFCKRK